MRCIAIIVFSLLSFLCQGQHEYGAHQDKASLLSALDQYKDDSTRAYLLNELSWAYHNTNVDSSKHYAALALETAKRVDYKVAISRALNLLAIVHMNNQNEYAARIKNEKALQLARSVNDSFMISAALNDLAILDDMSGDTQGALQKYQESLDYGKHLALNRFTLLNISILHYHLQDDSLANHYLGKAIQNIEDVEDPYILTSLMISVGELYWERGQRDSAMAVLNRVLLRAEKLDDKINHIRCLYSIAYHKEEVGEIELSEYYYLKGLKVATEHRYLETQKSILVSYIGMLNEQGAYERALFTLNTFDIPGNWHAIQDLNDKQAIFEEAARTHAALGSFELAYRLQDSAHLYYDSLLKLDKLRVVAELETKYQLKEQQNQNQLLLAEQGKKQLELESKNNTITSLLLASVFGIVITALLIILYWLKKRHNKELEKKVSEKTLALRLSNAELTSSNQELERFTYIASHDLKEPLRNIVSFASLIERRVPSVLEQEEPRRYFQHIKRNAQQLYQLIEDVLEFSKIRQANNIPMATVDLNKLVENVKYALKQNMEARNAVISYYGLPEITSNEQQLFLVLKNLIENGIKYNDSTLPKVEVTYRREKSMHQIIVSDNGIGIEKGYEEKIFEMFFRMHDRATYEGTGLGLAISKKILNKMGGEIEMQSRPGEGCTAIVSLPCV